MTELHSSERDTWETYAASWKAGTAEEKKALFVESLSPDCVYTDPVTQATGWDELVAYMLDFHRQIPGGHFVTRSFHHHHGFSLAHWDMVTGVGTVVGDGASYARFGDEGKLVAMTGFFEVPGQ
jgi:hypothetical protein